MSLIILISSLNLCLISEFDRVPKNLKKRKILPFIILFKLLGTAENPRKCNIPTLDSFWGLLHFILGIA